MQHSQFEMARWINEVTSYLTAMSQKVFHEIGETRNALAKLELANIDELQQGHRELKNHLQKEIKESQTTVEGSHPDEELGQPEDLDKVGHLQHCSLPLVTHRGPEGIGQIVPAQIVQTPTVFEGKTPWEVYLAQFNAITRINGWEDEQKVRFLPASYGDPALTVLKNLAPEKTQTRPGTSL